MRCERRHGRWSGPRRCTWLAAAVVLAVLAIAGPAQASSCTYWSHTVTVSMSGATDSANIGRVGNAIANFGAPCTDGSNEATVYNTDIIFVFDSYATHDGDDLLGIDLRGGPLAPGITNEGPSGVSEIEIDLYYSLPGRTRFWCRGAIAPTTSTRG
jgi:hypothetical protein